MRKITTAILCMLLLAACNATSEKPKEGPKQYEEVEAGVVVCTDSMPIIGDVLNGRQYKISILTTYLSHEGQYLIRAAYGHNIGETETQLPYLNQELRVAVRKNENTPYSYIIGFYMAEDSFSIFHDYMEATAQKTEIKFNYLRAYYLE